MQPPGGRSPRDPDPEFEAIAFKLSPRFQWLTDPSRLRSLGDRNRVFLFEIISIYRRVCL
ncbi:MAG: hypothetical protein D6680_07700 [Cyanobacteria bacterium J007]|nr:MAG: hypothetical protein D6680_07700 [Cyanobacteria bacterium J007]